MTGQSDVSLGSAQRGVTSHLLDHGQRQAWPNPHDDRDRAEIMEAEPGPADSSDQAHPVLGVTEVRVIELPTARPDKSGAVFGRPVVHLTRTGRITSVTGT